MDETWRVITFCYLTILAVVTYLNWIELQRYHDAITKWCSSLGNIGIPAYVVFCWLVMAVWLWPVVL